MIKRTDKKKTDEEKVQRVYNFNSSVGQFIEHVDTVNFTLDGNGQFHFNNVGQTVMKKLPSPHQMVAAVEQVIIEGLWYADRSWAVVFRVYQIAGYKGSVSNFVREVLAWPWSKPLECNPYDDAVTKPLRDGKMMSDVDDWEAEGVPSRNRVLAEALMRKLGLN